MPRLPSACAAVACLLALACAKKPASPPPQVPPQAASATPPPALPAAPAPKGLASPTSDAATVALANAALDCKWRPSCIGHGCPEHQALVNGDDSCPGMKSWKAAKIAGSEAGEATLVNMLEDPDSRVRMLGGWQLTFGGHGAWASNRDLARRVIAAGVVAADETGDVAPFAGAIGDIVYDATGLWSEAKAAIEAHPKIRETVLNAIAKYNAGNQEIWDWALSNAKRTNGNGVSYLVHFHTARQAEVCNVAKDTRSQGVYRADCLRRLHRFDRAKAVALATALASDRDPEVAGAVKGVLAAK